MNERIITLRVSKDDLDDLNIVIQNMTGFINEREKEPSELLQVRSLWRRLWQAYNKGAPALPGNADSNVNCLAEDRRARRLKRYQEEHLRRHPPDKDAM